MEQDCESPSESANSGALKTADDADMDMDEISCSECLSFTPMLRCIPLHE